MTIRATLKDGRTIASDTQTLLTTVAGTYSITFTIPELDVVEVVIEIQLETSPLFDPGTVVLKHIVGNVVGVTIVGVACGGTITAECVVIGH